MFSIKSVYALSGIGSIWDSSSAPMDAYLSNNSTIYNIMSDSNTTCKNYLESINYNLYGELGQIYDNYIIDMHYDSSYNSSDNTFRFTVYTDFSNFRVEYSSFNSSIDIVKLNISSARFLQPKVYKADCSNGKISFVEDKESYKTYDFYILEKRNIGYEFFPSLYQSSFGGVYYPSDSFSDLNNSSFALRGVYDNSQNEIMYIDDFVGSDYYSNNLLLGAGVPLVPFYSVISDDFSSLDVPYTGNYRYIYLTTNATLYFTPKTSLDYDGDKLLYIRPVVLDKKLSSEELYNIMGKADYKLGSYTDYKDLSSHTDYSFYWNNNHNDFFTLDINYLTSSNSMYGLLFDNKRLLNVAKINQSIVYYNPEFWNVSSYHLYTNATSVTINGVNGSVTHSGTNLNNTWTEIDKTDNVQNKPQYGNTDGSNIQGGTGTSFFDGLLGNIKGIGNFIGSVSSGILELTSSISALITMAFSTLDALPVAISSVFYLCFLLTMVAIILKIFL